MKKLINHWPYVMAILPQLIFTDYIWVIISTILIGSIAYYFIPAQKVFGKIFIIELVLFFILFFIVQDRVFYMKDVLKHFGLPTFILLVIFPFFNALNVGILFFTGYQISRLLLDKLMCKINPTHI